MSEEQQTVGYLLQMADDQIYKLSDENKKLKETIRIMRERLIWACDEIDKYREQNASDKEVRYE